MTTPKPPSDLKARGRGRELWREITEALDLDARDTAQLHEAARILDRLDAMDAHIRERGMFTPDGRVAPAVVEARQQGLALARILAALRLPEDLRTPAERPQQRAGARGFYSIGPKGRTA